MFVAGTIFHTFSTHFPPDLSLLRGEDNFSFSGPFGYLRRLRAFVGFVGESHQGPEMAKVGKVAMGPKGWCFFNVRATLPETNIAMENPPFGWYLPGKMGIFMGYVSFREGNDPNQWSANVLNSDFLITTWNSISKAVFKWMEVWWCPTIFDVMIWSHPTWKKVV